jgi:hydrogenase maturation protease
VGAIVVAIGNTLRGDDGAAHRLADLLGTGPEVDVRRVLQLTPELAEAMAHATTVVFADADPQAGAVQWEPLGVTEGRSSISHSMAPAELLALARRLYDFRGAAYVCHIPARDFSPGSALTRVAEAGARRGAALVSALVTSSASPY